MIKSDTIVELAKALNAFQGKLKAVKKDAINPFFKSHYATLDAIWDTIREPLSISGLAVVQTLSQTDDGKTLLDTTLLHTSGEWLSGSMLLNPVKDDPQGLGSAISYARRYSLCAMLGVVADEDDDANIATKPKAKTQEPPEGTTYKPEPVTSAQLKKIYASARERDIVDEVVAYMASTFGKAHSRELNKAEASQLIEAIEEGKITQSKSLIEEAKKMGAEEIK